MKKNVLNSAINQLGIEDGDVIKIHKECCDEIYQYENGAFTYLSGKEPAVMGDDEIFELLSGREFEIIAKGNKPLNIEEKLDYIEKTVNDTALNLIDLNELQTKIEIYAKKREKTLQIGCWIDLGIFALALLLICLL